MRIVDINNKIFGRLTVIRFSHFKNFSSTSNVAYWYCICECGNERVFDGRNLRSGNSRSCGCLCKEINSKRLKGISFTKEHKDRISKATIGRLIPEDMRRKISETKINREQSLGKNNPNWQGGIARKPYSFNFVSELRELTRKRDDYQCQSCGKKEIDLIGYHKKLPVHHVDYDKTNDNSNNLITLCHSCHSKTSFNRNNWQKHFETLMEEKNYNGILC